MADHHKVEVKKDRHSSNPKKVAAKGGGGGKGVWGKGGIDDLKATSTADEKDPNYDSDEHVEEVVMSKTEGVSPFVAIIQEYLLSGDVEEVEKSLKEIKTGNARYGQFVKKALSIGLEKGAYERELISKLLSQLYSKALHTEDIEDGFKLSLESIDELKLDNPDAVEVLSKFLARAVMDEIVPPVFLKNMTNSGKDKDNNDTTSSLSNNANEAIALSIALTTERHRSERLEHVWGPGDLTSVKRLKEEASLLIQEFNVNGDFEEADRAVRKINARSFHPQLVKQAIRLALQYTAASSSPNSGSSSGSITNDKMKHISSLLSYLNREGLISNDHIIRGFNLFNQSINDIILDIPNANQLFNQFIDIAKSDGYLSTDFKL